MLIIFSLILHQEVLPQTEEIYNKSNKLETDTNHHTTARRSGPESSQRFLRKNLQIFLEISPPNVGFVSFCVKQPGVANMSSLLWYFVMQNKHSSGAWTTPPNVIALGGGTFAAANSFFCWGRRLMINVFLQPFCFIPQVSSSGGVVLVLEGFFVAKSLKENSKWRWARIAVTAEPRREKSQKPTLMARE